MRLSLQAVSATLLLVSINFVAAGSSEGMLWPRGLASCAEHNFKPCGTGCIPLSWTCCPSHDGGCGPTQYCFLGSNDEYGCCKLGDQCSGAASATTSYFTSTKTRTQTLTLLPPIMTPPPNITTTMIIPPPTMTIAPNMTNATNPIPPPYPGAASTSNNYGFTAGLLGTLLVAIFTL